MYQICYDGLHIAVRECVLTASGSGAELGL